MKHIVFLLSALLLMASFSIAETIKVTWEYNGLEPDYFRIYNVDGELQVDDIPGNVNSTKLMVHGCFVGYVVAYYDELGAVTRPSKAFMHCSKEFPVVKNVRIHGLETN